MQSIKYILKYIGYILLTISYFIFFVLFLSYLAYFCSQILTGGNISPFLYKLFIDFGFIISNNMSINIMTSIIILAILISFIFMTSYMIQILKISNNKTITKIMKIKFNISFFILILLNFISVVFFDSYSMVPSSVPNGNFIPVGILLWLLVIVITNKRI